MANIEFHSKKIVSVQFQPRDVNCLTVASEDNRLSMWDLSA